MSLWDTQDCTVQNVIKRAGQEKKATWQNLLKPSCVTDEIELWLWRQSSVSRVKIALILALCWQMGEDSGNTLRKDMSLMLACAKF